MNHLSFFLHTQTQDVNHVTPKSSVNASQFVMCSPWRTFIMEKQAEKYAQMSCVFAMWAKVGHILYIYTYLQVAGPWQHDGGFAGQIL